MRIAFLLSRFPCISETFVLNQITGLIDRGHEVAIFAEAPAAEATVHQDVLAYGLLGRTRYYGTCAMPKSKTSRVAAGVRIIAANMGRNPRALAGALNVFRFGRRAASLAILYMIAPFLAGKFDIVHCHFGPNGMKGALLKDLGAINAKLVTSFHGYDMSSYPREHGEDVYEGLFGKGDLFLPISEVWRDRLVRFGCDRRRIRVHHMGIDTKRYRFRARRPLSDGKVLLVTVARLVEKKGVAHGIRAVAKALRTYPGLEYLIVGDGPLRGSLQSLIDDLGVGASVKLTGWKEQEDIVELMERAHILLAPSVTDGRGDQEGIPVAIMEAMATGMPVISTMHSGIPELVQDGRCGFLVPEGDEEALAGRILFLAGHHETWGPMGRQGRTIVEEQYDINRLNDRMAVLYEDIAGRPLCAAGGAGRQQ